MRDQVQQLEARKQQLEARYGQDKTHKTVPTPTQDLTPAATAELEDARRRFLQVTKQIEALRVQNQALGEEISRRELVRNAVQVTVDEDQAQPQEYFEPPIMSDVQAMLMRQKLCAQVDAMLLRLDTMQRITELEVFGWSDLRFNGTGHGFIDIAIRKKFYLESADELWGKDLEELHDAAGHHGLLQGLLQNAAGV